MANNDYAARQQEKIKQTTEKLEQGIKDFLSGDQYQDYLKVMSRFHNYSYSNSILIAMQRPDATLLAGYSGWQKKFNRHVLPGEKGIKIFAPAPVKKVTEQERIDPDTNLPVLDENGDPVKDRVEVKIPSFKVVTVFDVSQTDGQPLPQLASDLSGNVQNYAVFMEALRRTSSVPIEILPLPERSDGYFSLDQQKIAIREGMSEIQTVSAAIHEIAHALLHNHKKIKEPKHAEIYQEIEIFDVPGLFSNGRIAREDIPKGLYCYDLRGSDDDPGMPATIERHVKVNHAGSILTAKPLAIPQEGYLKLTEEEGLNFTGDEISAYQFLNEQRNNRRTEEIEAESISFVVCSYYGIATEENSFGYIASWSKDKEIKELRTSLETIHKTSSKLISDIDAHYAEIMQEQEQLQTVMQKQASNDLETSPSQAVTAKDAVETLHNPDGEQNFRIRETSHNTFCVHSDSERFGEDAIVFESHSRAECVDYIADRKEPETWKFYIIPDLKTWSDGRHGQAPTRIEHYDTLSEALTRFTELRREPYNMETAPIPDTNRSYARLTLGIEGVSIPTALDVIHVEAGNNVLCEDFTRLSTTNTDRNALSAVAAIVEAIPVKQVNHYHVMTPEEVKAFTLAHLLDKLHREGVTDTSAVEAGFDAYYESGGADYLKPSKNQQQGFTLIDYSSWKNPYFSLPEQGTTPNKTPEQQLASDLAVFCRTYDPYSFGSPDNSDDNLAADLLNDLQSGNPDGIRKWLWEVIDAKDGYDKEASSLMDRIQTQFPPAEASKDQKTLNQEPTITFYAAECMEFANRGVYENNLSLPEALAVYDSIPPERMNGVPCIGFHLHDGSIYDGDYPLMHGGQIDRDAINLVEHYKESPLVQKAITDLQAILDERTMQKRADERFADPQEACYKIGSMYLYLQQASDESWDYTLYDSHLSEMDGGQLGDCNTPLSEVRDDLIAELSYSSKKTVTQIPVEQFEQMLEDREQSLKSPVFEKSLQEVFGTPELEIWRISHHANTACKEQFDQEFGPAYHARQVPDEYYGAAEPPVRCGVSHLSGLTEPSFDSYSAWAGSKPYTSLMERSFAGSMLSMLILYES